MTYDSLKKVLEVNPRAKEEQDRRRRELLESFRTAPFEEIVAKSEASVSLQHILYSLYSLCRVLYFHYCGNEIMNVWVAMSFLLFY